MKFYKFYTIEGNGVQGTYYKTAQEAQAEADRRNALHGGRKVWAVREVYTLDEYAAEVGPYCRKVKRA